jgi:hypothetical protein
MNNHYEKIQDLTYLGDMNQVLEYLGNIDPENNTDSLRLSLLHANILEETGGLARSNQSFLKNRRDSETSFYLQARLLYLKQDYFTSLDMFRELSQCSGSIKIKAAALMGIANIQLSDPNCTNVNDRMNDLSALMNQAAPPEKMAGMLLLGDYHNRVRNDQVSAMQLQNFVMSRSLTKGWNYFVVRAIYGLIGSNSVSGNKVAARKLFDLLSIYCKSLNQEHLLSMAKDRFRSLLTDETSVEVDVEGMKIKMGRRWVRMNRKPLLLNFLAKIFQNPDGISIIDLASALWPDKPFQKLSVEARIFDLAKRAKNFLRTEGFGHIGISFRAGFCILFYDND